MSKVVLRPALPPKPKPRTREEIIEGIRREKEEKKIRPPVIRPPAAPPRGPLLRMFFQPLTTTPITKEHIAKIEELRYIAQKAQPPQQTVKPPAPQSKVQIVTTSRPYEKPSPPPSPAKKIIESPPPKISGPPEAYIPKPLPPPPPKPVAKPVEKPLPAGTLPATQKIDQTLADKDKLRRGITSTDIKEKVNETKEELKSKIESKGIEQKLAVDTRVEFTVRALRLPYYTPADKPRAGDLIVVEGAVKYKDAFKNERAVRDAELNMTVRGPISLSRKIKADANGHFSANFTAEKAGVYTIVLEYGGGTIPVVDTLIPWTGKGSRANHIITVDISLEEEKKKIESITKEAIEKTKKAEELKAKGIPVVCNPVATVLELSGPSSITSRGNKITGSLKTINGVPVKNAPLSIFLNGVKIKDIRTDYNGEFVDVIDIPEISVLADTKLSLDIFDKKVAGTEFKSISGIVSYTIPDIPNQIIEVSHPGGTEGGCFITNPTRKSLSIPVSYPRGLITADLPIKIITEDPIIETIRSRAGELRAEYPASRLIPSGKTRAKLKAVYDGGDEFVHGIVRVRLKPCTIEREITFTTLIQRLPDAERIEEERKRAEEALNKARREAEELREKIEEEKRRAEEARRKADEEARRRAEEERKRLEEELRNKIREQEELSKKLRETQKEYSEKLRPAIIPPKPTIEKPTPPPKITPPTPQEKIIRSTPPKIEVITPPPVVGEPKGVIISYKLGGSTEVVTRGEAYAEAAINPYGYVKNVGNVKGTFRIGFNGSSVDTLVLNPNETGFFSIFGEMKKTTEPTVTYTITVYCVETGKITDTKTFTIKNLGPLPTVPVKPTVPIPKPPEIVPPKPPVPAPPIAPPKPPAPPTIPPEERKRLEEVIKRAEEEAKKLEEARRKYEEEARRLEEERKKLEEEKKFEEAKRVEEARKRAEEEARRAEEERKRLEEEAIKAREKIAPPIRPVEVVRKVIEERPIITAILSLFRR
jgi:hypothetical protein